jgi:hypothetical protein
MVPTIASSLPHDSLTITRVDDHRFDDRDHNQHYPAETFTNALEESIKSRRLTPTSSSSPTPSSSAMKESIPMKKTAIRCVSFPGNDQECSLHQRLEIIHSIGSLDEYTQEEHSQTWYSRQEYSAIRASYTDLIHRIRNKEWIAETEDTSTRGIEGRSRAGEKARREIQIKSMVSVLSEQQRQRVEGRTDPEALAIGYRQYAYHALQAAANMGRRDAQAVVAFDINDNDDNGEASLDGQFLSDRWHGSSNHDSVHRQGLVVPTHQASPRGETNFSATAAFQPRVGLNLGLQQPLQQQHPSNVRVPRNGLGARRAGNIARSHRRAAAA